MLAPSLTVAAVLTLNLSWNSYLWPLIVTSSDALRTLPLGMGAFEKTFYTLYGEIMAVSVFGTIPLILFFMLFQKYFIESAVTANLK
jgi:ABC-type glycerol-3-phosphate transport system permease component